MIARLILHVVKVGVPLLLLVAQEASATPEFAQKFKAKCRTCHIKNTAADLNQTGLDFKSAMEKEQGKDAKKEGQGTEPAASSAGASRPEGKGSPTPSDGAGKPAETRTGPEKELNVYQWVGKDGSVTLTDTPRSTAAVPAKVDSSRHDRHEKSRAPRRSAPKQQVALTQEPAPAQPKGTYAHCMEQLLMTQPKAEDSRRMMDMLGEAERRCAPLRPKERRP